MRRWLVAGVAFAQLPIVWAQSPRLFLPHAHLASTAFPLIPLQGEMFSSNPAFAEEEGAAPKEAKRSKSGREVRRGRPLWLPGLLAGAGGGSGPTKHGPAHATTGSQPA